MMTITFGTFGRLRAALAALAAAVVLATAMLSASVAAEAPANDYPYGNCTWWVVERLGETGNVAAASVIDAWPKPPPRHASTWRDLSGWLTGTVPRPGAIAWWPASTIRPYGHVAFVESVTDATHAYISEWNVKNDLKRSPDRTIDVTAEHAKSGMEFIYPPGSAVPVITPTAPPAAGQGLPPGAPAKTYTCSALLSNAEVKQATGMAGLKFSETLSRATGETDCRFALDGRPDVALDVSVNTGEAYKGMFTQFWGITPVVPLSGVGEMAQYNAQNNAGMAVARGVGIVVQLTPPDRDMKAAFEKLLRLLVGRV
jgi:surface antigen